MENLEIFEDFGNIQLVDKCNTFYARKLGVSHRKTGKVCQDYCKVFNIDENVQVVCVADGHGSLACCSPSGHKSSNTTE